MRKLINRKIVEQNRQCAICEVAFTNYSDIVPDHIDPRGMGGSRRDDHPENIQAVHFWCNGEKGSTREYRDCGLTFRVPFDRVLNLGYKPCFGTHIAHPGRRFSMSQLASAATNEKQHRRRISPVRRLQTAIACRTSARASRTTFRSPGMRAISR